MWEEIVDALQSVNGGPHPGFRAVHAKGTVCKGTFTPTTEAARLSRAAHLQSGPVDVASTGAIAVTLESAGGAPQPTTQPLIVAPVKKS